MMTLESLVPEMPLRSFIAYVVWMLFDSDRERFRLKIFFFTYDFSNHVRQWIIAKFGPDPGQIESIRAL
jgi:hypothetical protein